MPRSKKYYNSEELRISRNEKAKRYYQKNAEKISKQNREKYQSKKTYYVYKVTLPSTGQFYIGSRGCYCSAEEDTNYTGSQSKWNLTKEERGLLIKEILKKDITSMADAIEYEAKLIAENINNPLNENYFIPNKNFTADNKVTVKNLDGKIILVSKDDPRYLSGELKFMHCGKVTVSNGDKIIMVDVNDPRYLSGELKFIHYGKVQVNDGNKKISVNKDDPRYLSGELKSSTKGTVLVTDKNGNKMRVSINDPRYISGELKFIATNKVSVKDNNGKCFYVDRNDPRYLSGELVGSSKGYWSWSTRIMIDNQITKAIDFSKIYNVKVKDLKKFLEDNNIKYKKIS